MTYHDITPDDRKFMDLACKLAEENVNAGGGPFGAIIVRNGEIISTGVNTVTRDNDPTAHAEMNAIRSACQSLDRFKLGDCVIYSSCEPCPMCLSALYWAGVKRIYYGNTKEDADRINFSDSFIYKEIDKKPAERMIPCIHIEGTTATKAFDLWEKSTDKIVY